MSDETSKSHESEKPGETPNSISDKKRRDIVKGTVASGAVVASGAWVEPVITSAILPAHARATGYSLYEPKSETFIVESESDDKNDDTLAADSIQDSDDKTS